jgi:phospholipid N-methyltransferase
MKKPTWLMDFSQNAYSQAGEDGIIIKILEILPENDRWCVEFGAADGIFYSNTRNLIINEGYSAILIEADKGLFKKLQKNYLGNPNVITINQFVGWSDKDNLDQILSSTPIPEDFDLLSIDIDGRE